MRPLQYRENDAPLLEISARLPNHAHMGTGIAERRAADAARKRKRRAELATAIANGPEDPLYQQATALADRCSGGQSCSPITQPSRHADRERRRHAVQKATDPPTRRQKLAAAMENGPEDPLYRAATSLADRYD